MNNAINQGGKAMKRVLKKKPKKEILSGKKLTIKNILEKCETKRWRYVWIYGFSGQKYNAALRKDGKEVVKDSRKGGYVLQVVGIESIEFEDRWQSCDLL